MTFATLHRLAAGAFMTSGLLLGYSYITHPHHMPPEVIASTSWIVIHSLFLASLIAGIFGTTGFYLRTAIQTGVIGLTGFILAIIGLVMIGGLDYYEVFIAPYLATAFPEVIEQHGAGDAMGPVAFAFPISGALTVSGYMILAIGNLRAGTFSRAAMLTLFATSIVFGFGLSPAGGLMAARIGALLFGLSLIWSGLTYWRSVSDSDPNAIVSETGTAAT